MWRRPRASSGASRLKRDAGPAESFRRFVSPLVVAACLTIAASDASAVQSLTIGPNTIPADAETTVVFAVRGFPPDTTIEIRTAPRFSCSEPLKGQDNITITLVTDSAGSASATRVIATADTSRVWDCIVTASVPSSDGLGVWPSATLTTVPEDSPPTDGGSGGGGSGGSDDGGSGDSGGGTGGDEPAERGPEAAWYLPPASEPARQGFVRVLNHSDAAGEATVRATDDAGVEYPPLTLAL